MVYLLIAWWLSMAMLVITRGYTSIFLWFSYGFPMVFLWFYYIPTFWTMLSPYEFHASPIRWSPRLLVSSKSLRMKTFLPRATKWTHAKHLSMDWYGDYIGFLWISGNIMRLYGMIMGWSWDDHGMIMGWSWGNQPLFTIQWNGLSENLNRKPWFFVWHI